MSKLKKILVFTATYNEIKNIKELILKIKKTYPKTHILIIDDNSPDGTGVEIMKLKKKIKNLFLISRKKKQGLDTAHKLGYEFALKKKYNYLITMDADLSHHPKEIKNFINHLSKYSFVKASVKSEVSKFATSLSMLFTNSLYSGSGWSSMCIATISPHNAFSSMFYNLFT